MTDSQHALGTSLSSRLVRLELCDVPEETKRNGLTRLRLVVRRGFFSFLFLRAYYSTVTYKNTFDSRRSSGSVQRLLFKF